MAKVLRLADIAQSVTYNLREGALRLEGGTRAASPVDEERVQETMNLIGENSDASLMAAVTSLDAFRERVDRFHGYSLEYDSQWLEENAGSESARRALLWAIGDNEPVTLGTYTSKLLGTGVARVPFSLVRSRLWELVASTTVTSSAVSCWGGKVALSSIPGDTLARLWYMSLAAYAGGSGQIYKLWAGIREAHVGTSGYAPVWELEDGTALADTVAASEVGASPSGSTTNNKMRCTFDLLTGLVTRVRIALNAGGRSSYDHYVGRYRVLLRCKLATTPATQCGVRLYYSYTGANGIAPVGEEVFISNTNYDLIPLGSIQLPPDGRLYGDTATNLLSRFEFQIRAELLTGTPGTSWLDLDAILLMPEEHLFYAEGATTVFSSSPDNARPVEAWTREDGRQTARSLNGGAPQSLIPSFTDWALPKDDSVLVLAATQTTAHVLSDNLNLTLKYVPRWYSYRS